MKQYFLISTDHLVDRLWFRDEDDFRVAMNYVAVAAFLSGVLVLAFILMSNHVHFVICGSRDRTELFINKFKQLYATYYKRKYGVCELLRRNGVDFREVRDDDESLERAIAYVLMNCVAANICMEPSGYPWGTGNTLFNSNPFPGRKRFVIGHVIPYLSHQQDEYESGYDQTGQLKQNGRDTSDTWG